MPPTGQGATISLEGRIGGFGESVQVGEEFEFFIELDVPANTPVFEATAALRFDPGLLEVVAVESPSVYGRDEIFDDFIETEDTDPPERFDNEAGTVMLNLAEFYPGLTGDNLYIATLRFRAKSVTGDSTTNISFDYTSRGSGPSYAIALDENSNPADILDIVLSSHDFKINPQTPIIASFLPTSATEGFSENLIIVVEGTQFGVAPDIRLIDGGGTEIYDPFNEWVNDERTRISAEIGPDLNDIAEDRFRVKVITAEGAFGTTSINISLKPDAGLSITSLSPQSFDTELSEPTDLTIDGANFRTSPVGTEPLVRLIRDDGAVTFIDEIQVTLDQNGDGVFDDDRIIATLPVDLVGGHAYSVQVIGGNGTTSGFSALVRDGLTVAVTPQISDVSPSILQEGYADATPFTISGRYFKQGDLAATLVDGGGSSVDLSVDSLADDSITGTIPAGLVAGTYRLDVTNNEHFVQFANALEVLPPPTIDAIAPAQTGEGYADPVPVTISGANFIEDDTTAQLIDSQGNATGLDNLTATRTSISAEIPLGLLQDVYDLEVVVAGTIIIVQDAFTVLPPPIVIDSITPNQIISGFDTPQLVTIDGSNFIPGETEVQLIPSSDTGTVIGLDIQSVTTDTITGLIPVAQKAIGLEGQIHVSVEAAVYNVTVSAGIQDVTLDAGFEILGPVIDSFSPSEWTTGFTEAIPVTLAGQNLNNVTEVSMTGPKITGPPGGPKLGVPQFFVALENVQITPTAISGDIPGTGLVQGPFRFRLTTADDTVAALEDLDSFLFQPLPFVESVDPPVIFEDYDSSAEITIIGSSFLASSQARLIGKTGQEFELDQESVEIIEFNDQGLSLAATLTAQLPAGIPPDTYDVQVYDGAGAPTATLPGGFTILPVPEITSITPDSVFADYNVGDQIRVSGSNFLPDSQIRMTRSILTFELGGTPDGDDIIGNLPADMEFLQLVLAYAVEVYSPTYPDQVTTLQNAFGVDGRATVTSMSPNSVGPTSSGKSWTLNGHNFNIPFISIHYLRLIGQNTGQGLLERGTVDSEGKTITGTFTFDLLPDTYDVEACLGDLSSCTPTNTLVGAFTVTEGAARTPVEIPVALIEKIRERSTTLEVTWSPAPAVLETDTYTVRIREDGEEIRKIEDVQDTAIAITDLELKNNKTYELEVQASSPDGSTSVILTDEIRPRSANLDFDPEEKVNFGDLGVLVRNWGQRDHPADINGDGRVGFGDLWELIKRWTF